MPGRRWRSKTGCPGAGEPAAQRSVKELQRSIRCLINEERGKRDLGRLARDKDLQEVGLAHSEVMVETNCLAHQCAGEEDLETRLREAGYFDGAEMWQFAENTGCALSAEAMVANWMATRFHRVNILERRFHEIGVGAVEGRVKDQLQEGLRDVRGRARLARRRHPAPLSGSASGSGVRAQAPIIGPLRAWCSW